MKTRRLGNTDLRLSEIGFGAWAIGGSGWKFGWGPQDDDAAVAAIRRALELGVNWIDTAAVYGLGHSEELVARALDGHRRDVILATKCSLIWDDEGKITSSLARESVRRECEGSLRRLRTDCIDLYQVHWPNDDARIEEGWDEIGRMIDEGKIRYAGVSNFQIEHLDRAHRSRPTASLQSSYSILQRSVEHALLPWCARQGVGFLAYSPMASGLLTGRFDRTRLSGDDWRTRSPEFNEPNLSANLEVVEGLRDIALRHGKTVSQVAIAWVLRRLEVTSAIVGVRNPKQIEETAGGAGWRLDSDALGDIDRLIEQREEKVPSATVRFR